MRKSVYVCAIVVALAQSASAEYVKPETAAQYARHLLEMKEAPVPENAGALRVAGRDNQASGPEYYVFNNPDGGWVIISADDCVTPVIGYSHEGSFNTSAMPANVSWWMQGVSRTIQDIKESGIETPASVTEAWNSLASFSAVPDSGSKVIETALWHQVDPFNKFCPVVNGENKHAVTGCVATAMAIICRHNRWPLNGRGVIGGYTTQTFKTYIPPYSIDSHVYDWDNMPLSDGAKKISGWTTEQKDQAAQLMLDCGVMVNMDYTYDEGSGTLSSYVKDAFIDHLSYSDAATYVRRSSYTLQEWFNILRREIDANRVVFYVGVGDEGGHAFVCDGYDTDGMKLHFNWGSGGKYNGYFYTLPELTLSDGSSFPDMQEAIIGLAADTATVELDVKPHIAFFGTRGIYGIEPITPVDMVAGSKVSFSFGFMLNNELYDVTFDVKVCLMDKDGSVKQEGWHESVTIPARDGYMYDFDTEEDILTVTPEFTDYFKLFVKENNGDWMPMPGDRDIFPDKEDVRCGVTPDPVILISDDCSAGQKIKLVLSLGFHPYKSVEWSVNGNAIDGAETELVSGRNVIRADVGYLDGSTGSIFRTVTVE